MGVGRVVIVWWPTRTFLVRMTDLRLHTALSTSGSLKPRRRKL